MPLGYAGLAVSVALLGAYTTGQLTSSLMAAAMTLVVGGIVQLIAAFMAYRNGDSLSLTIFGIFGALFGGIGVLFFYHDLSRMPATLIAGHGIPWFWFCWAIVATYIWIATLRLNAAVALVQLLLAAALWATWLATLTGSGLASGWANIAGWIAWATAIVAAYTSFAELINRMFGRIVLPEFPVGSQMRQVPQ
jgi:succinate-acetate transporter protein